MREAGQLPWFSRLIKREGHKEPQDRVILTPRLRLRPPALSDAQAFFAYASNPQVARYVLWLPHENPGVSRQALRGILYRNRVEHLRTYALTLKGDPRMIGTIGLVFYDRENSLAEVGFSMSHLYWGQGLMTEALTAYLRTAFTHWGINRVEAQHDQRNPASGRVMEKAGMTREGILQQRLYYKGCHANMVLYAALRQPWLEAHPGPGQARGR